MRGTCSGWCYSIYCHAHCMQQTSGALNFLAPQWQVMASYCQSFTISLYLYVAFVCLPLITVIYYSHLLRKDTNNVCVTLRKKLFNIMIFLVSVIGFCSFIWTSILGFRLGRQYNNVGSESQLWQLELWYVMHLFCTYVSCILISIFSL